MNTLPERIDTVAELEDVLSRPSPALVEFVRHLDGDIMILGAGEGKDVTPPTRSEGFAPKIVNIKGRQGHVPSK